MIRRFALAALLGLVALGCTSINLNMNAPKTCADGLPPRIFVHSQCNNGICGYTCAPDRWPAPIPRVDTRK